MNYFWGSLMALIGILLFIGAITKSDFIIYKLIYSKVKILLKDKAHSFLAFVGIIITGLSSLFFFGIWG